MAMNKFIRLCMRVSTFVAYFVIDLQEPCVIFFFLALYLLVISSNCFVPLLFPHQVMKN